MPLFGSKKKTSEIPAPEGPPSRPPPSSSASNSYRSGHGSSQPPPPSNQYGRRGPPPGQGPPPNGPPRPGYGPPQGHYQQGPGQLNGYAPPPQGPASYGPAPQSRQNSYGQPGPPQSQSDPSRSALSAGGRQNSGPNPYAGTVPQGQGEQQQAGPGAYGAGSGSYNAGGRGPSGPGGGVGATSNVSAGAAYLAATGGGLNGSARQPQSQEGDENEEIEGIKHMIKQTNQQSLASTRNALRTAREAEEVARATVEKLGEQSERFAATEQHLDMAKNYAARTEDNTKEIKALNRSIFRPNITFNKQKKRDAADQRILDRHIAEKEERELAMRDATRARNLADGALGHRPGYGPRGGEEDTGRAGRRDYAERSKYTFEADEEDQAMEDEIEDNLDEMTRLARSLNGLATAQGDILTAHNVKLATLNEKADALDIRLVRGTQRMKHI